MEKLPKIALPFIVVAIVLVILLSKSAVTIGSGEAGVYIKHSIMVWLQTPRL